MTESRCEDPKVLQRICDRLGSGAVKSFFWRWQRWLPSPLTRADVRAGSLSYLDMVKEAARSQPAPTSKGSRADITKIAPRRHL